MDRATLGRWLSLAAHFRGPAVDYASGDQVLMQWFERARFEYHPENPAAYRVLLGRLGVEVRNERGR